MKFKNIKKTTKPPKNRKEKSAKPQFPNISRFITEKGMFKNSPKLTFSLSKQSKLHKILAFTAAITVFVISIVLVSGIAFFSLKVYQNYQKVTQITMQRQQIQGKINFWQSIADKYDGYKDAYFQMAILDYQLGNFAKAKLENQKALTLDPNFVDAKNLKNVLDSK